MAEPKAGSGRLVRLLNKVAAIGNKLPDPITLFVILAGIVALASALAAGVTEAVM